MPLKRSYWKPAVIGIVAVASGGWLLQQGSDGNVYVKMRMLQDVVRTVSDRYVDEVDPTELYDLAIDGLLERLGDPHSNLLRPEDYSDLRLQTTGNYGGLGIRIDEKDGWITVVQTLPKTPAERAGLRPGDRIVEVDGVSSRSWTPDDAVQVLRGPKGSPVNIKISRIGVADLIPVEIVRDEIHVEYVTGFMYEDGIGYILHQQFSERSADDIRLLVDELTAEGMKGLIFDLRGNPGGLLDEGVAVSDLFLNRGNEVVETRSRIADQNDTYRATRKPIDPDLPVIVLVDGFSASASEIVAGALQDHDRALVLGTRTFGKGSVQTLFPLSGGNYLKLTTAKWYTPSGRSIHRDRDPDMVALAVPEEQLEDGPDRNALGDAVREVYYTDAGREVFGGGGINPDLVVHGDTLLSVERQFRSELGQDIPAYSDAVFRFSVAYTNEHPSLRPDFEVTDAMFDELYAWITDSGIEVRIDLYEGSERLIHRELGIQLATVAFDSEDSTRRRLVLDRQVATAAQLLRESQTQNRLFALAEERQDEEQAVHQN